MTCDPHFRTCPSYSSQKSCVKMWFGVAEPESYRVHKLKKKKKKIKTKSDAAQNNILRNIHSVQITRKNNNKTKSQTRLKIIPSGGKKKSLRAVKIIIFSYLFLRMCIFSQCFHQNFNPIYKKWPN